MFAPFEDSTIKGGTKLVDELSLKLHLPRCRCCVTWSGSDSTKLRQALESFNNTELRISSERRRELFRREAVPGCGVACGTVGQFKAALESAKFGFDEGTGRPGRWQWRRRR